MPISAASSFLSDHPLISREIVAANTSDGAIAPLPITSGDAAPATTLSRQGRRRLRKQARAQAKAAEQLSIEAMSDDEYRECLQQAEICREQARAAARLKRFKAARGLFATAISLCQRALGLGKNEDATASADKLESQAFDVQGREEAREYLRQLTIEMSTYSELAKSMERPLDQGSHAAHTATTAASEASRKSDMPLASTTPSFSSP